MQTCVTRSDRRVGNLFGLLTFVLLVSVFGRSSLSVAEDGIPPVRQLIAETLKLCNVDRESNTSALNNIAEAQCYLGDFAAARKSLLPYEPTDFFQQAIHQQCARIEIEITGSVDSIPKALWNDELGLGFMHGDAALAFITRGEIDKAMGQIAEIPRSAHSAFNVSGVKLIQSLREAKQDDACRKVLLRWASCYEKTDSIFHYRESHLIARLVSWLVELNERDSAKALCDQWHAVLQMETDVRERGESIGRGWAGYAVAIQVLGDRSGANTALAQANQWMDKAYGASVTSIERLKCLDFAKAYAAIAARRAVVLGAEEATPTYNRAYELAQASVTPEYGEHAFESVVKEQLIAGDENGALETLKQMKTPRTIARSWKLICENELMRGNVERARAAARSAVQALDQDGFEPFMAQEMSPVAATAALAGEKELAQRLFKRAIGLSETNETPKFNHPWIAGIQVHAGLLEDAYRSIQSVEDPARRTSPLARLCKALAKAEYEAKRAVPLQKP